MRSVEPLPGPVALLELDFTEPAAAEKIDEALGGPAAAVFCDAAPKLTGIRDVDRAALEEIHLAALRICESVLKPGGSLVLKGFPGPESDGVRELLRRTFGGVSEVRPEGKRSTSKEFYWIARDPLSPPRRPPETRS